MFFGGGEIPTENVGNWQGGKKNSHVFYTLEPKQGVTFLGGEIPKEKCGLFWGHSHVFFKGCASNFWNNPLPATPKFK